MGPADGVAAASVDIVASVVSAIIGVTGSIGLACGLAATIGILSELSCRELRAGSNFK